jgi:hypothetical protein
MKERLWLSLVLFIAISSVHAQFNFPTVTITAQPSSVVSGQELDIIVTASSSYGIFNISYSSDNKETWTAHLCNGETTCSRTWRITEDYASGTHYYYARAYDNSELRGEREERIGVQVGENFPPAINSFSIIPNPIRPGEQFTVSFGVSDENGVRKVELLRNSIIVNGYQCDSQTVCSYSWTRTEQAAGSYAYSINVTDFFSKSTLSQAVTVIVSENSVPSFTSSPVTTAAVGSLYGYTAVAVDPDGDAVSYSLYGNAPVYYPSGMQINPTSGLVTWTPQASGTYDVNICATDGHCSCSLASLTCNLQTYQVTVSAPSCVPSGGACSEGQCCSGLVCTDGRCCLTGQCYDAANNACGSCPCTPGETKPCPKQQGVCAGSFVTCSFGVWPQCDYSLIQGYELVEVSCDGLDNNCDGSIDEGLKPRFYRDADSDGFGNLTNFVEACTLPQGYSTIPGDCNDNNPNVHPNAVEICNNNIDDNCNGLVDCQDPYCMFGDWWQQYYPYNPCQCTPTNNGVEICDGRDNDCNGIIDDIIPPACTVQCPNGVAQGVRICINGVLQPCNAVCPENREIIIKSPLEKIYTSCEPFLYLPLKVEYMPGVKCYFRLSGMNFFSDLLPSFPVAAGTHTLTAKCADKTKTIEFDVAVSDCQHVPPPAFDDIIKTLRPEMNLTDEDIDNARNTSNALTQKTQVSFQDNSTIVKHTLYPERGMEDVRVVLYIPKCMAEHIDLIEVDLEEFTIIQDDPVIAWHFTSIKDRIDLSYKVKGYIDPECLEEIRLLPIAKYIKMRNPGIIDKFIIPLILIASSISLVLYVNTHHPHDEKTDPDKMLSSVENARKKLIKDMRSMKMTNEQARTYLEQIRASKSDIAWIMKRY